MNFHPNFFFRFFLLALTLFFLNLKFTTAQILENYAVVELKKAAYNRDPQQVVSYFGFNDELDQTALECLASLQEDSLAYKIYPFLNSSKPGIRQWAAFALGQSISDSLSVINYTPKMLQHLSKETDLKTSVYLLEALGKIGSEQTLQQVAQLSFKTSALKNGQALSIAKFAERGLADSLSVALVCSIYSDRATRSKNDIHYSIYALSQVRKPKFLKNALGVLLEASESSNIEVRLHALQALSRLSIPKAINAVLVGAQDTNWRVSSWSSQTLAKYMSASMGFKSIAIKTLMKNLRLDAHPHVVEASLNSLIALNPYDTSIVSAILPLLSSPSERIQNMAMKTLAQLFPNQAEKELLKLINTKASNPAQLEAVGVLSISQQHLNLDFMPWLLKHTMLNQPDMATAAINSWGQCWNIYRNTMAGYDMWTTTDTLFEGVLLRALKKHSSKDSPNPAAVKTITAILSDDFLPKEKYLEVLTTALDQFSNAQDINTILHLLESLGNLKTKKSIALVKKYIYFENRAVRNKASEVYEEMTGTTAPVPPTFIPPKKMDVERYRDIVENPVAHIQTSKGKISIELFLDHATFTVINFMELIQTGFYDGLTLHRVVPNFVIQGGDPNGDGTGGPGYTIRSEFTTQSFKRGIVGMAHAGKDTEGSQFFVMLSHHPFLDGKYTPFGKVIEGMNVVDQLEIGDRIERVELTIKRLEE